MLRESDFAGSHVFTRNLAAAANLLAIGGHLRESMPVTAGARVGHPDDLIFWFENDKIECSGIKTSASTWLGLFSCAWNEFSLPLEHPAAFLKAAAENRAILVRGAKMAKDNPFKILQHGNRIAVIGPAVTEANARRLLTQG